MIECPSLVRSDRKRGDIRIIIPGKRGDLCRCAGQCHVCQLQPFADAHGRYARTRRVERELHAFRYPDLGTGVLISPLVSTSQISIYLIGECTVLERELDTLQFAPVDGGQFQIFATHGTILNLGIGGIPAAIRAATEKPSSDNNGILRGSLDLCYSVFGIGEMPVTPGQSDQPISSLIQCDIEISYLTGRFVVFGIFTIGITRTATFHGGDHPTIMRKCAVPLCLDIGGCYFRPQGTSTDNEV